MTMALLARIVQKDGIEMIAPHRCNRSKPPTQERVAGPGQPPIFWRYLIDIGLRLDSVS
jgi:hypothetical protein